MDRRRVGMIFGAIGVIGAITALVVDEIVLFYSSKNKDFDDSYGSCGWNKIRGKLGGISISEKYDNCCSGSNNCCDAETAGILWLVWIILCIVCGVIGIGVELGKRKKFTELCYDAACIFSFVAVISYFVNNELCWDSSDVKHERSRFGTSAWTMVATSVCLFIAAVLSHDKHGYIRI